MQKAGASPACIAIENPIFRFDVDPVLRSIVPLGTPLLISNILYGQSHTPNVFLRDSDAAGLIAFGFMPKHARRLAGLDDIFDRLNDPPTATFPEGHL
jgi:hypothetical protein